MSLAHEQKSPPAVQPPGLSLWRTFRFPLIVLLLFGAIFAIPWICLALKIDIDEAMMIMMATQWHGPALAVLLIALWWLFFSGFHWFTKVGWLALVVLGSVGFFYFGVRDFEVTKGQVGLVPRFHFVWERTANDELSRYLNEQPAGDDLPPIDAQVGPEDFPSYRGIKQNGTALFAKLEPDWKKSPPKVQWLHPCPGGYSGVAVAGNIVVTLEQRNSAETVVCYDRATGRQRWAYESEAYYKDAMKMGDGPRSTPTIFGQHIYSIGATGNLVCINAEGKKQWSRNILTDAKAKNIKWGLTASPLLVDDLVIAHAGIDEDAPADSALIAYAQATGDIRWRAGKRKAAYSSPQLATFAKTRQIVLFDGAGLVAYDPKTGKELWQFPWVTSFDMNSIQPLCFDDDRIFLSSEADNGCAMLRILPPVDDKAAWSVETVWKNKNLAARYANPVTDGKQIFGLHGSAGHLRCLDAKTGKVKWRGGEQDPGQLLLTDGALLVVNGETGDVRLFDTGSEDENLLATFAAFKKADKTWNTPALAGDQLFIRNQAEIACVKLPRR